MNKQQTEFFNGYVMARIAENLAIDKESLVKKLAEETSNLFTGKSTAMKHAERSVNRLVKMGFIDVNDAGNLVQDDPSGAFRNLAE